MKRSKSFNIIFDGECLMCNGFLRFVDSCATNSKENINAFSSIDSYLRRQTIDNFEYEKLRIISSSTIIVIKDGEKPIIMSRAIEAIFTASNSLILAILARIMKSIPYKSKDFIYTLIARYRHKIKIFQGGKCNISPLKNIHVFS